MPCDTLSTTLSGTRHCKNDEFYNSNPPQILSRNSGRPVFHAPAHDAFPSSVFYDTPADSGRCKNVSTGPALFQRDSAFRADIHFAPIIPLGVLVFYSAFCAAELLAALVARWLKLLSAPLAFVLCFIPYFLRFPSFLLYYTAFLRRFVSIFRLQRCPRLLC